MTFKQAAQGAPGWAQTTPPHTTDATEIQLKVARGDCTCSCVRDTGMALARFVLGSGGAWPTEPMSDETATHKSQQRNTEQGTYEL